MKKFVILSVILFSAALAMPTFASHALNSQTKAALDRISVETGSALTVISTRQDGRPKNVVGNLSLPSAGTAAGIAQNFISNNQFIFAAPAETLQVTKVTTSGPLRIVRFEQTLNGLPVVGSSLTIVVRDDGVVRSVSGNVEDLGGLDTTPAVADLDAATAAIKDSPFFVPNNLEGFFARLVVLAYPGSHGRLAWELHFGALPAFLSNVWAYVDAQNGEVIRHENRIVFAYKGIAFETNPGSAGERVDPIEVDLDIPEGAMEYTTPDYPQEIIDNIKTACDFTAGQDDCPSGSDTVWLRHPLFMARNCPDYQELVPLDLSSLGMGEIDVHMCSEAQTASADADDNFFYDDWKDANGDFYDLDPNDTFAEVQMFYHVGKVYNFFLDLMDNTPEDWGGHAVKPMMATVNYKLPVNISGGIDLADILSKIGEITSPDGPLYNFDNAFFMPGGGSMGIPGLDRPFDSIVFGQGSKGDFSWDGDVVYHEFGHSVDNSLTGGLAMYTNFGDEWGVNVEPGGLSEGYADVFAGFITNEPRMGEYSLHELGGTRYLSGDDICPDYLMGEVHYDSFAWAQSVYQARTAAVEEVSATLSQDEARHLFHQATFVALAGLGPNLGFGDAAALTLTAVEDFMGAAARSAAEEAFDKHQTNPCPRITTDEGSGKVVRDTPLLTPATVSGVKGNPFTPGVLQYMVTVPDGTPAINMEMLLSPELGGMGMSGGVTKLNVIVRHDNPIKFTYELGATGDDESVLFDDDVMGPYPPEKDGSVATSQSIAFSLVGTDGDDLPAGEYYLMPVNSGGAGAMMNNIEVEIGDPTANEDGTHEYGSDPPPPSTDSDTDTDTDTDTDADTDDAGTADSDTDTDTDTDTDGGTDSADDDDDAGCGCKTTGISTAKPLWSVLGHLFS